MRYLKHETHKRAYYTNLAVSRAIYGDAATFFAEYQAQKVCEWFKTIQYAPIKILDFGCSDGLMTSFMQHLFINAQLYGIDSSQEHIALAHEMYAGIQFMHSSIPLPFDDNSFDLIYASHVFHHIPRTNHARIIAELMRILKPNGSLVIMEFNPLNIVTRYRFNHDPAEHDARMMAPWHTHALVKAYGPIKIRFYDFLPNLRIIESYCAWLPLGKLYAVIIQKK